ncbi:MAG: DUF551 domain-containing protein [Faecousia sp.]
MTTEEIIHIFENSRLVSEHFDSEAVTAAYVGGLAALREQEERRWIPVTERMPEKGGTYLCVWQGKKVDTGFFCNGHFRLYGEIKDNLITHWMPMPEPPKED